MQLRLPIVPIGRILALLAIVFAVAHVLSLTLHDAFENRVTELLVEKFSLEGEGNFPAFFSALLLFVSGLLFLLISKTEKQAGGLTASRYWLGLCFVFLFLSLDEAAQIHEKLDTDAIWGAYESTGMLAWPWVIVYGTLAMLFAIGYFRFWLRLPATFKSAYMIAAVVYVGSALGFEMLEALEYTTNNGVTFKYVVLTSIEEMLEMGAITFLIFTNLRYLTTRFPTLQFAFTRDETRQAVGSS